MPVAQEPSQRLGLSCGPRDGVQVHYHTALSLNPHNEDGRRGLERLEKLLKGNT